MQNQIDNTHQNGIREVLSGHQLIPVVTFNSTEEAVPVMEKIISKGAYCIEVTLRTSCAEQCISILRKQYGEKITIGAGTVINNDQVLKMKSLNVDFLVSPGFSDNLLENMESSGIAYLPGAATPGEMVRAIEKNCFTLKFFPANLFGGVNALKTYGGLFPNLKFCPTGGISENNYKEFLQLQNVLTVGGSWLYA
ncbi:MAG: bifunctional 4-hydroxy-2-oxoglutarate aldolase/2-dehydro-3-deoxy-phosphogluconate aldolase [Bacteroidota bacterium]|jgi:2-dehydro-3-deoxyphosphogluconate aldolase/(4S)-4-hydroxy-2-oxoglutarate aldolase